MEVLDVLFKRSAARFHRKLCEKPPYKIHRSAIRALKDGILLTLFFTAEEEGREQLLSAIAIDACKKYFEGTAFSFSNDHYFSEGFYKRNYFLSYSAPSFEEDVKSVLEKQERKGGNHATSKNVKGEANK
jgi:hypothetical protein